MNDAKNDQMSVIKTGSSTYYALLHCKKQTKQALTAFVAFIKTIQKITLEYKEKEIAKTKIKWWQKEISNIYQGSPTHPVAYSLLPILKKYGIPQQLFEEYLDGAILKIDTDHFCTEKDIEFFSYREYGLMLIAISYILYDTPNEISQGIHQLANALTRVDLILQAKKYAEKNKQIFSLELLEENKVMSDTAASEETLQTLFQTSADKAISYYQSACKSLNRKQQKALKPILIYLNIQLKLLQEVKKDNFKLYHYQYQLTPIRKYFIALLS